MSSRHDDLRELFSRTGQNPDLAEALMRIDAVFQNWRRRMHKRELGHRALKALDLDIDLAQLDVLFAIAAPQHEFEDNAADETMVSTVAERLGIDPSRASRVVAEMVTAGYARRAVSQRDARRTILELTQAGQAVVDAVRGYKWLVLGDYFAEWPRSDLDAFVPLLERYSNWMAHSQSSETRFAAEIDAMAEAIKRAQTTPHSGSKSG